MSAPELAVRLGQLTLPTPLVAASGTCGYGEEFARVAGFDYAWLGALTLKSTTLAPRRGNPAPRTVETPAGLLNAIGLENPGIERVLAEHLPRLAGLPCRIIANAAGATVEEYAAVAARFSASGLVHAVELNFSCPNVHSGQALGSDARACGEAVAAIRPATALPLFVKLPPNVPDIRPIVEAALAAGANGVTLTNTLPALAFDRRTGRPALGNVSGGLSGPALKPVALYHVARARAIARRRGAAIIGLGGVRSAEDALDFLRAGAGAVGLGTWLLRDPLAAGTILAGLREHLALRGLKSAGELVGEAGIWD